MSSSIAVDEEPVIELDLYRTADGDLSAELVRRAVEISERREDRLPWLLNHPSLTEPFLTVLIESDPTLLPELGHQAGPPMLLRFLADKYRYPEAVLTIAKRYFASPEVSDSDFATFLVSHEENEWMLNSLSYLDPSSPEKQNRLVDSLRRHPTAYDYYIELQRGLQRERRARDSANLEELQMLFDTNDPAALRGLAANPRTAREMLENLLLVQGVKGAKEIRRLASDTLRGFANS